MVIERNNVTLLRLLLALTPYIFFMLLLLRLLLGCYPVASHPIILFLRFPLGIKHSQMYKRTLLQAFYSGTSI